MVHPYLRHGIRGVMWYQGTYIEFPVAADFCKQMGPLYKVKTDTTILVHRTRYRTKLGGSFGLSPCTLPIRPNLKDRTDTTILVCWSRYRTKLGCLFGSSRYTLPICPNLASLQVKQTPNTIGICTSAPSQPWSGTGENYGQRPLGQSQVFPLDLCSCQPLWGQEWRRFGGIRCDM